MTAQYLLHIHTFYNIHAAEGMSYEGVTLWGCDKAVA